MAFDCSLELTSTILKKLKRKQQQGICWMKWNSLFINYLGGVIASVQGRRTRPLIKSLSFSLCLSSSPSNFPLLPFSFFPLFPHFFSLLLSLLCYFSTLYLLVTFMLYCIMINSWHVISLITWTTQWNGWENAISTLSHKVLLPTRDYFHEVNSAEKVYFLLY